MKHSAIHVISYGGYDIPGLESWLSSMAEKGMRFVSTAGPLALFDQVQPQKVQIHLEPIQGSTDEDPQLNAIYENSGWQYWGMFRGSYYVYASPDMEAQAYTDPDSLDYALKKFFRQKLALGLPLLLGNFLLPGLYGQGAPWELSDTLLRYYPVETLSNGTTIPFILAVLGFFLIDLSYLAGLFHLMGYRRAVKTGGKVRGHRGIGWLLAAGLLILLPVLFNTFQIFAGLDYRPYDLEDSGFVTLSDLEGNDFPISRREPLSMDYISHGGTLFQPEYWYFRQYGAYGQNKTADDVPHLEISIVRYPLGQLAQARAEEWSRQSFNGSGEYEVLEPAYGLDEIRYAPRERRTHTNELTGETHDFLPGGIFVLRRGNTVLFADYYGEQNLPEYLPLFAATFDAL